MKTRPRPTNNRSVITLADLKTQLLTQAIWDSDNETCSRLVRLAASEAEALAWQTPYPLLFLPALLEEKLAMVRHYAARQARLKSPQAHQKAPLSGRQKQTSLRGLMNVRSQP